MKQFLLLLCLAVFTGSLSAQVFVNAAAADGGDGTTWATAYNSLSDALTAAAPDAELWVAAGTYTTPADSSFYIAKGLTVLGGFDGTETAASAANPAANATILSGDVMGNDGPTYDSLAYMDNNRVLTIVDTSTMASQYTVTLDGMTITNGGIAINIPDSTSFVSTVGAGIFSSAKLVASRLTFNKNRSLRGSAVALISATANESVLDSLSLDNNYSGDNRQIYLNGVDGAVVSNSTFNSDPDVVQQSGYIQAVGAEGFTVENCAFANMNSAFSGAGVRFDGGANQIVRNCTFDNLIASTGGGVFTTGALDVMVSNCDFKNIATGGAGGGIATFDGDNMVVSNSTFDSLAASTGGAIYHQQDDDLVTPDGMDADDFIIDGCTITNCATTGRGGGVTAFNTNIQITKTTISDNTTGSIGGGLYQVPVDARSYVMVLDNATFERNTDNGVGGAICLLVFGNDNGNASLEGTVTSSTFNENVSSDRGSVMYNQGTHNFTISNSVFDKNDGAAGTIYMSGTAGITLNNCDFTENGNTTTAYRGAVITAFLNDDSPGVMVDSSSFVDNVITERAGAVGGGGVMFLIGGGATAIPLTLNNSLFSGNAAGGEEAGGVLYLQAGFDLQIDNSEFLNNSAGGDGGVISEIVFINSRDTIDGVQTVNWNPWMADVQNSKFIGSSSGSQGGAISTQRAGIDFTNCVFANNIVGGAGSGGAIIFNGLAPAIGDDGSVTNNGELQIEAAFVSNTFVGNLKGDGDGAVGASLALFQPGDTESMDSSSIKITLTNNVFLSSDESFLEPAIEVELGADEPGGFIPIGNLIFESLGGNYFNVENGPEVDLGMNGDIVNEDIDDQDKVAALFIDILDDEGLGVNAQLNPGMDLGASNPLIDGGVTNALTPDTDIDGFPRGVTYDIGAYEVDGQLTETNEPVENSGLELKFFPNPTMGELNIQNNDTSISTFKVVVSDQAGRILQASRFFGVSNRMDFSRLPMGVYNLQLYVNGSVYSKQIVKQ
jgi:hypothetical protein